MFDPFAEDRILALNMKFIILQLLKKTPMHGYQLAKAIEQHFNKAPSMGTLHPSLLKMEKDGLVRGYGNIEYARYKKIYSITDKGEQMLASSKDTMLKFLKD